MDRIVYVPLPDFETRFHIFEIQKQSSKWDSNIDLTYLTKLVKKNIL